jgi:hypothetical protein
MSVDRRIGPNCRFSVDPIDLPVLREGAAIAGRTPSSLMSYAMLRKLPDVRAVVRLDDWMLDSGAFSAHNSGTSIDLDAYIEFVLRLAVQDRNLTEVVALDVIGDWRASVRNAETMWKAGIRAIPTFHFGSPPDVLLGLANDYPKIALGGMVALRSNLKRDFIAQCFARVWPAAVHGFGVGSAPLMMEFPWSSVDSTTWKIGPWRYGRPSWMNGAGRSAYAIDGTFGRRSALPEIAHYLRLESRMVGLWSRELAQLPYRTGSVLVAQAKEIA